MAIESLALLLFAQQRDRFFVKIDGADALLAFRRAEAEAVALSRELMPHSQSGSIEVHVTPSQPEQLTASHSCCCGEVIEDEFSILGCESQECRKLVCRPCLHPRSVLRFAMSSLGGILASETIGNGFLQSL